MPPSDLINVRNFRDKFSGLVRSQKDRGLLNAQSEWAEEIQQEVASRCQIVDDLSFSNAAFVNPTLFHMLRQHREFNDETEREWLQRKRDLAIEQDLQRQEKLDEIQNAYAASMENQQEQLAQDKFRTVKTSLDESTLASLREANRRMVPARYRLEVNFMSNRVQPEEQVPNSTPVADDEVILSVCFYNTRSSNAKMEEYLVLGSQSLTVLRDAFYCISDFLISHRDEVTENSKEKKTSSSYFFIEKTFYNDMRSPTATDYSRVITEWASDPERQEKNPKLRGLQSRLMDGARFQDLSIRLKQPYIFMHQGDCEHVMMFTDLRLLGPKDDQFVESYPKQIFRTRHMRHKCRMCSAYPAQFVTKNDFHSGMSPCYFCEKCYTPFHFGADEEKLLDHDVFPYANVNYI
ncbi:hypothetical protein GGI24_002403 [Coemansia furcata]|nr:hypothetical protein GGI24_002403 [Coemansia furcata]